MSIKNLKSLARNLGLFVASAMLSLLLAEWSVRTLYPQQLAVWYTTEDGLVIHPPGLITYLTESKQETKTTETYETSGESMSRSCDGPKQDRQSESPPWPNLIVQLARKTLTGGVSNQKPGGYFCELKVR